MPLEVTSNVALCSIRTLRPMMTLLHERGIDMQDVLQSQGLTDSDFEDGDLRIAHAKMATLVMKAIERSGEPALGVLAAERAQPGDYGVAEYTSRTCATMQEGIQAGLRFMSLLHSGIGLGFQPDPDEDRVALTFELAEGLTYVPAAMEFTVAAWLHNARRFTGKRLRPYEVTFAHLGPAAHAEHDRVFGAPVRFGAPRTAIWMSRRALELPYRESDPHLKEILQRHGETMLGAVPKRQRFSERVLKLIHEELEGGNPGSEHIAERLHMSARTLHRRLKAEGTTHRQLSDELRRSIALRLLLDDSLPIGEVSYRLGFSHVNAFHKAFRRWRSQTPAQYRQERTVRAVV